MAVHGPAGLVENPPPGELERSVTLTGRVTADEMEKLRRALGSDRFDEGRFPLAARLFDELMTGTEFAEFLTLKAYDHID